MKKQEMQKLLDEADELLGIAWGALLKMRLDNAGDDCRLSHEVRMFSLAFSKKDPNATEYFAKGDGRLAAWRDAKRGDK